MNWEIVWTGLGAVERGGPSVEVKGVEYDSRRVVRGDVFVAMRGEATDGNRYIEAAVAQGAAAVVTDSQEAYAKLRREHVDVAAALVEHGRRALAEVSAAVMGHPERRLALSAVTGTNGKTTTAFLLEAMLRSVGRTCVLIGTIETHVGDEIRVSPHTTPEASDTLRVFADGVAVGATEAVMEMSSHALEQERVWGLPVDVAMFTNLTQDHLDYHRTMGAYFSAKAKLFRGVGTPPPRIAIVNLDDSSGVYMASLARRSLVWRYGWEKKNGLDIRAENVMLRAGETTFTWKTPWGSIEMRSPLTGRVNVYNLLAAASAALGRHMSLEQIAAAAERLEQVPGRFEVVPSSNGVTVVVDYAHKPVQPTRLTNRMKQLLAPG